MNTMPPSHAAARATDYLPRVRDCNGYDLAGFTPWTVQGRIVGWLRPQFAQRLLGFATVFQPQPTGLALHPHLTSFQDRSEALSNVLDVLLAEGVIHRHKGEPYPVVAEDRHRPLLVLDRAAVPWFGIRAFGQHLNGWLTRQGEPWMWLGRRALDRFVEPGRLDQLVAGGLPYGLSLADNLRKECQEEASIPASLVDQAVAVGCVSYCIDTPRGLKPDTLFCYDLELPEGFEPRCSDGEVAEFLLLPAYEVARLVREGHDFKQNCNLVVIDFLIRHGLIEADDPDYPRLVTALHPALPGD